VLPVERLRVEVERVPVEALRVRLVLLRRVLLVLLRRVPLVVFWVAIGWRSLLRVLCGSLL
jgi:hypothetical protein